MSPGGPSKKQMKKQLEEEDERINGVQSKSKEFK